MKLQYELSELARKDINSIWIYTAEKWSTDQANSYYKRIFDSIGSICTNPQLGKSIDEVKKTHRSMLVGSHLIIYKIEDLRVFVDRVLHQSMDIESQLEG